MSFSPKGKKPVGNPIVVVSGQRFGGAFRLTSQPKPRILQIADNFFCGVYAKASLRPLRVAGCLA
jgi:hypothetical protein